MSRLHLPIPLRSNLVAQIVKILADEISSGRFQRTLPGEHSLCESFCVSRTTLRPALEILERQGYIRSHQGRPRVILRKGKPSPAKFQGKRNIALAAGTSLHAATRHTNEVISQVLVTLQSMGYHCSYLSDRRFSAGPCANLLNRTLAKSPNSIWILISCSEATQGWFYRTGHPAFVLGHLHAGIKLPAFDVDFYSVGRHAAAQILGRGHRRIGIVVPNPRSAGDLSAETGFNETVQNARISREWLLTLRVKWHRDDIERAVDSLYRHPHPPTALFVLHEETAVCIYSALYRRGIRVPQDVSIIIGDGGRFLETFVPDFAHYRVDLDTEVKRTCVAIDSFASSGVSPATLRLLMPKFHRGETMAAPPTNVAVSKA